MFPKFPENWNTLFRSDSSFLLLTYNLSPAGFVCLVGWLVTSRMVLLLVHPREWGCLISWYLQPLGIGAVLILSKNIRICFDHC